MNQPAEWELHPQLVRETMTVGDLPLARVLASKDGNYPWLILVPRRLVGTEIFDLAESDQKTLIGEIAGVSKALKAMTGCDKINVGNVGIVVPQLHVHVVARRRGDAAWPRGVWGTVPPKAYEPGVLEKFVDNARQALGL